VQADETALRFADKAWDVTVVNEFLLLMPGSSVEGAMTAVKPLREAIADNHPCLANKRSASSVRRSGLVCQASQECCVEVLIAQADAALYRMQGCRHQLSAVWRAGRWPITI